MKALLIFAALVAASSASTILRALAREKPGTCPAPSVMAGICVFDPNVNCINDNECPQGQRCCPEGCNSVCKHILSYDTPVHDGSCPAPTSEIGICVLLPNSCSADSDCALNEKCCHEGCNLVCKTAIHHDIIG